MNLLLLSNSSSDAGYLVHALPDIRELIASLPQGAPAVFVPYAGVTRDWDEYTALVASALADTGLDIQGLHRAADPVAALEGAAVIIVGGGNTFNLLGQLRRQGLLEVIARRVRAGAAYLGWSAGSNLSCPSICTTNDMPITDPKGFDALGLLSFQINPHYTNAHPPGHRGETRAQRLAEFCTLNPQMPVLGLPEGSALRVRGSQIDLIGPHDAPLFLGREEPRVFRPGSVEIQA
ncbi:dipeptidase PepE [Achromobacter insolitus]|uniref:Peptidase E n=1 Tax=Achromobacter insolitus TaxID=217204 RepID=A0A6S7F7U3_9BURK|nr:MULTISPECIES: dipeptidase PepE [Achromobacter]GLK92898.1 peptidase E [Achromobacter xylosoxidans]APX75122.1 dipeptidase E [Achromobacter insolitus]AVG40053.1 dipeptidase PepE [Achromobacter insolitus]AXA70690.1 dipeptidase E [Achromobacter insolitus]MCP1402612.1 dipeptidase E [Achromobacter insolitus]